MIAYYGLLPHQCSILSCSVVFRHTHHTLPHRAPSLAINFRGPTTRPQERQIIFRVEFFNVVINKEIPAVDKRFYPTLFANKKARKINIK